MITVYPHDTLGHANYGWLDARYHFSFARYYNPARMGFGALRVINDDCVRPGRGFDTHQHEDMEIITFVRKGAITHRDSQGNEGKTEAGNVQVMSAGTGIAHSEFNLEDVDTLLFQIWIEPNQKDVKPQWGMATFATKTPGDTLPLLVSGRPEDKDKGALFIHQEASIYGGTIAPNTTVTHPIKDLGYVVVSSGTITVLGEKITEGDGMEIMDQNSFTFTTGPEPAEIIVIDVPK